MVREILEIEEADVTLVDSDGVSALVAAANNENYDIVQMMRKHLK